MRKRRAVLIAYLSEKVEAEDWHGVADAAMDLRDLDEYVRGWEAAVGQAPPSVPLAYPRVCGDCEEGIHASHLGLVGGCVAKTSGLGWACFCAWRATSS